MKTTTTRAGRRFRLLIYERLYSILRWPLWLIELGLAVLWWRAPFVPLLAPLDGWMLFLAALCLLAWAVMYIMRFLAYVQCRPDFLLLQTPLLRLAISYSRIRSVRPIIFREMYPPAKQRWSQKHFLEPIFGLTGVGVTLASYPISHRWLKFWLNDYLFTLDAPGFLLMVDDWMTLSRQIDVFRDHWRDRKARSAPPAAISLNPFLDR